MSVNTYVSRVIQLDALILDTEFYSLIRNQIFQILNLLKAGHFSQKYAPEIQVLIKFLIWKLTVFRRESTVGHTLLGVKFPSSEGKGKLKLLFLLEALIPYVYERFVTFFRSKSFFKKIEKPLKYTEDALKVCEIVNFCIFLMQNRYPSFVNRILRLPVIPAYQRVHPSVGYSYQVRELLWHQFADFLMIVLPLVNVHRLRRYLRNWGIGPYLHVKSSTSNSDQEISDGTVLKCCICKQDAVIPQQYDACAFCYYCIKANTLADSEFKCSDCPHVQS